MIIKIDDNEFPDHSELLQIQLQKLEVESYKNFEMMEELIEIARGNRELAQKYQKLITNMVDFVRLNFDPDFTIQDIDDKDG
ncbi:hypothetical protein [Acinetobacter soli]|uniref:hypothetical protein n=1 Tax=Acinetobacter soli TaxID=487316 RepID=UPI0012509426|nr:hypothetical protein [Acinetobacter soli]